VGPADGDARWSNKVDEIDVVSRESKQRLANPDDVTLARCGSG